MSSRYKVTLATQDEVTQEFTTAQIANIKANMPTRMANVNITPYHIYDEDEHQVGEWRQTIDGVKKYKPVYEKTIDFGTMPNATTKNVAHGISNLEIVLHDYGTFSNGTTTFMLPNFVSGGYYAKIIVNATNVSVESSSNLSSYTKTYITLCYTKTTDTWQPV